MIYVIFLQDGAPTVKYFGIENVENANGDGVLASINNAFKRFGVMNLKNFFCGLNYDAVSVIKL